MRNHYLADFAFLLHINPRQVDDLRLLDFAQLVLFIDDYWEAQKANSE